MLCFKKYFFFNKLAFLLEYCPPLGRFYPFLTTLQNSDGKSTSYFFLKCDYKKHRRGSNMRRGSNIVGSASNCIQCFEIQASAQLEPGFGVYFNDRIFCTI